MDEHRYRPQHSPRTEAPMNSFVSPPRNGIRMPPPPAPSHDSRSSLPRRFTADSGHVPTLSTVNMNSQQRDLQNYAPSSQYKKAQLLEKKRIEYEQIVESKRHFEAEMARLQEDLGMAPMPAPMPASSPGHQSEPTTPPEFHESSSGMPTYLSFQKPNRYSTSVLLSRPVVSDWPARPGGSQLPSPQPGTRPSAFALDDQFAARSFAASSRDSDESEKEEALRQDPTSHRSTNALNRYSMPVTKSGNLYDDFIDRNGTARFLFSDDTAALENSHSSSPSGAKAALEGRGHADEAFPQVYTPKGNHRLSAASTAVDVSTLEESNRWNKTTTSIRQSQQAPSHDSPAFVSANTSAEINSSLGSRSSAYTSGASVESKVDMNYLQNEGAGANESSANVMSPLVTQARTGSPLSPLLHRSTYSDNDISVSKSGGGSQSSNAHAQQHFHHHNLSIGRIPVGIVNKSHGRELSADNYNSFMQSQGQAGGQAVSQAAPQSASFPTISSTLHAGAPSFGHSHTPQPSMVQPSQFGNGNAGSLAPPLGSYQQPYVSTYSSPSGIPHAIPHAIPQGSGYNIGLLSDGMANMGLQPGYPALSYGGYGSIYQSGVAQPRRGQDSQQRVMTQRRAQDNEAMGRYMDLPLDLVGGQILALSRDQHGCRYLQKQLETRDANKVHTIWLETNQHVATLMQDGFGNYLIQKLVEFCTDRERTILIQNAAPEMVTIAMNQHGTRALQKMIESITLPEQVEIVIGALDKRVVDLIQDLNGNHVIQKCLNKLSPGDADFIIRAVGYNSVEVGCHRHGCCVLQRCVDHASGMQKAWLISRITEHAQRLVLDPFGNYVVQYIIDLNEQAFTEPVVQKLSGQVCKLSKHKFSSNVIEKCLRCASDSSRDRMVEEILSQGQMERLLKDQYANYVVQTALEHSTYHMKMRLVDAIRPILPIIRCTTYGRRLQAKIHAYDSRGAFNATGQTVPTDTTQGQVSLRSTLPADVGGNVMNGNTATGLAQGVYPTSDQIVVPSNPQYGHRPTVSYPLPGGTGQAGVAEGQFF